MNRCQLQGFSMKDVAPAMIRADRFNGAPVVKKQTAEMRKSYLTKSRGRESPRRRRRSCRVRDASDDFATKSKRW